MDSLKVLSGNGCINLARKVAGQLNVKLIEPVTTFADGEVQIIGTTDYLRGTDAFVIQSICNSESPEAKKANKYNSGNDNLMELLCLLDSLKRADARNITAVITYYGYGRQDRKVEAHTPISARLVADLIQIAGAKRIVGMELHSAPIQGFFDIPADNLYDYPNRDKWIKKKFAKQINNKKLVIVSPDAGGVEVARKLAERIGAFLAIIDKRRNVPNEAEAMNVIGDVDKRVCVIVDDMSDTSGTLIKAAIALREKGAVEVHADCVHAVLSPPAVERLNGSEINSLDVTDTIPLHKDARLCEKIKVRPIFDIIAKAIYKLHVGDPLKELFPPK